MPRIAIVTGTRAEFGLLEPVLRALRRTRRVHTRLFVTGMHLLRRFGHTVEHIRESGFDIAACIPMQRGDDHPIDQAQGLGRGIAGLARAFQAHRCQLVVILGDRIEALAGALAGVTTGRAVAHIHGGDVALGDFDDSLRHAITKLAHIHLAATRDAARRIIRMGEDPRRVYVVGAPGLDRIRELLQRGHPRRRDPAALVVLHPTGRPARTEQRFARAVLDAVATAGLRRIVIYPNSDRGFTGIVAAIEAHRRRQPEAVDVVRALPRDAYLGLLLRVRVLVGNSSSGVIEAPFAGTPAVNIGDRQQHRRSGGRGVFHAPETPDAIAEAIRRALRSRLRAGQATVYGDGHAAERIAEILAGLRIDRALLRKCIRY